MISYLKYVFALNCFTDSTSVILSKQTRMPTFTATLLSDNSKDAIVCNQFVGQSYQISLDFGGFIITYPTQNLLESSISLTFPCTDVNNCDAAFLATSVSFKLTFPDTNTIVEDAVSTYAIDKYNRLNCIYNQLISYDKDTKDIKITANAQNCQFQIQPNLMATLKLTVYPRFIIQKQFSLNGVTNVGQLFSNMNMNCDNDFIGTQKRVCNRILMLFQSQLDNKAEIILSLPAVIPGRTSQYNRQSEIQLFSKINTISSSFVDKFDCYTQQQAVLFANMIKINYEINQLQQYCSQNIDQFIGQFNKLVLILQITNDEQENIQFKFVINNISSIQLNANKQWLECKNEYSGVAACIQKIANLHKTSIYSGIISREFFQDLTLIKQVQNSIEYQKSYYANAEATLSTSSFCFSTTNNDDINDFYQVQVQLIRGLPRYSPDQHQQVLNLQSQIYFPGNIGKDQYGQYCFNLSLSSVDKQKFAYIAKNTQEVTGVISIVGTQIAIYKLHVELNAQNINYMCIASILIVSSSIVWFIISIRFMI
ncbi:Conserved_hypothetical protein [Hexamita inflata]|uniref:Transmembrane protein n=1 Tax=Hexamita inflata TaxID=28002 RepID=A0AA86U2B9_9EUKA|nr:Conserved hypothetical protein [Hexamita inflata]